MQEDPNKGTPVALLLQMEMMFGVPNHQPLELSQQESIKNGQGHKPTKSGYNNQKQ